MQKTKGNRILIDYQKRTSEYEGVWTAYCDALSLVTCADSKEEALEKLELVVGSFARALQRKGILTETLEKLGVEYEVVEKSGVLV